MFDCCAITNPEVNKAAAAAATPIRIQRDLIDTTPYSELERPRQKKGTSDASVHERQRGTRKFCASNRKRSTWTLPCHDFSPLIKCGFVSSSLEEGGRVSR